MIALARSLGGSTPISAARNCLALDSTVRLIGEIPSLARWKLTTTRAALIFPREIVLERILFLDILLSRCPIFPPTIVHVVEP